MVAASVLLCAAREGMSASGERRLGRGGGGKVGSKTNFSSVKVRWSQTLELVEGGQGVKEEEEAVGDGTSPARGRAQMRSSHLFS